MSDAKSAFISIFPFLELLPIINFVCENMAQRNKMTLRLFWKVLRKLV
jgi:hypothetical protein